ncbi:PP2C family protein-serine/threonine phosphatase [Kutzneria chonburiensis]|uniref:PP2C family protein-serine/threonine phosphatase n=1 Tax=Kutzneria chonburiensis TaxID=1483604 RepID=A0ABV6MNN9_9PSEU|nr:protein phosphatase 2C domain-containing protein [Kutzneria chonburiensis]
MASDELIRVRVSLATAVGRRDRNEDAVGVDGLVCTGNSGIPVHIDLIVPVDRPLNIAVVDGMGGHADGDRAAVLAAELLSSDQTGDPVSLFGAISERMRAEGNGMGCTAAMLSLSATGNVVLANVGDVRVYRLQDGFAGQLTTDHRAGSSVVTRCLGGGEHSSFVPAVRLQALRSGDRYLLCSDGVHDAVRKEALVAATSSSEGGEVVGRLVRDAVETEHGDNATAVLVDVMAA